LALYDKLSARSGLIAEALDRTARRLADWRIPTMSNEKPTAASASSSSANSTRSPKEHREYVKSCLDELKDWIKQGHIQNSQFEIHWTPEELAEMTPEQKARCVPQK